MLKFSKVIETLMFFVDNMYQKKLNKSNLKAFIDKK